MPRVTLYVRPDLKARMDVAGKTFNWSRIAQNAFQDALGMAKTKAPATMDDDTFMLEEMRLRLECLRLANVIDENNDLPTTDTVLRRAKYYWRFVSDAEAEETPDADA